MRKSFYSLLAMAMCLFVSTSCSEEELTYEGGDKQNVTFQVEMEDAGTGSRALSDGSNVDVVYYAVYESGKDQLLTYGDETVSNGAASVIIPLVNGLKFDIVFFAHCTNGSAFDVPSDGDLRNIQMKDALKANQEAYDAFFHARKEFQTTSNTTTPVTLKRPLAQLNVATTDEDLVNAANLNATVTHSKVVLKGVPTSFDARSGIASGSENVTFETEAILKRADGTNEQLIVGAKQFYYLAMAYVLVNDESGLFDSEFEFYRADEDDQNAVGDMVSKRVIPNLPLQRNYRTNVTGNILTQNENFSITLDTRFDNYHHLEASDITVKNLNELNTALANLAKQNIKELILNVKGLSTYTDVAINIPDDATVSSITLNLLDLNASVSNLEVSGAVYDKPVLVSIPTTTTVVTTTINVPNAHVTLKKGTHTQVISSTSPGTLEVAAGTVITNLIVKKGNVEIKNDGTVGSITTDGTLDITVSVEPGGTLTNVPTSDNIKVETTLENIGEEWILTENVELMGPISIATDKTMTIDLNGYTLSQKKECTAPYSMIENKGTLTIKDTKGTGKISFTDLSAGNGSTWGSYTITNNGTLVIESGTIEHLGSTSEWGNNTPTDIAIQNYEGKVTINGGKIISEHFRSLRDFTAGGEIIINGGIFKGQIWMQGLGDGSSSLTINGGEFSPSEGDMSSIFITNSTNDIEFSVTGGTFNTKIGCSDASKLAGSISGGTFTVAAKEGTNEALLAEKYSFEENEDGTYNVVKGDYLSFGEFVNAVIGANGIYDGQGALVKIVPVSGQTDNSNGCKVPDRLQKYSNPEVYYAQYQRFSELTDVSISNVNFEFVPAAVTVTDAWNTAGATTTAENINGELQFMNTGSVTLTNCTFDMVAVSPISASTLVVEGCTFKNLMAYAIKDIKASEVSINENSFETCNGGFWFAAAPTTLTVKKNTFSEVGRRGAIQFSEKGDYTNTTMSISGNKVEGKGAFLWQLNSTVTADQIIAILENNTFETAFVDGSVTPGILTPDNYVTTTLESKKNYTLYGDFGSKNVSLVMAVGTENVVLDGSKATNINELIITQNGALIDNATTPIGERSGKVTVQNFNVLSQINVFACKTEVVVQKNTAEALMIYAGNCDVKVLNNTIDANFESHPTYRDENNTWNTNNYGIALNIFDYNLWLDGNTVTDATGHAIGINGWEGTIDNGDENVIESFKSNKITVNSTTNTKRAAFKVWDDETYASNDDDTNVVNTTAQAFIDAVLADGSNTFNIIEGYEHTIFSFYNVNTNN